MTDMPLSAPPGAATHLRGRRLVLARTMWVALVGFTIALFAVSISTYFTRLQAICVTPVACAMDGALSPASMHAVRQIGLSPYSYAVYTVALYIFVEVVWAAVGFLIFWRRSDQWIGLVGAFVFVTYNLGVREGVTYVLPLAAPAWDFPVKCVNSLVIGGVVLFFFLFPNGRIAPRWMRWPVVMFAFVPAVTIFSPANSPLNTDTGNPWINSLTFLGTLTAITLTQIYRYRRVSGPREREQMKWALFGMSSSVIGVFCLNLAPLLVPALQNTNGPYNALLNTVYPLALLPIPMFVAVSILRSRLWDIDVIIRRTLIYGTLTSLLAGVYLAVVVSAQTVGQRVTGQNQLPPWLIVITTLLVATLVAPLRRQVQRVIDRSFYRTRYDAARTVEAFASTLRTELDLSDLHAHLIQVVDQTMRPAHISLWLRSSPPRRT